MKRREALGKYNENNYIINKLDLFNHKELYLNRDPHLTYYLITYVCNYTNDSHKSYRTLYNAISNLFEKEGSQISLGWEVNERGYMHVHALMAFKKIPKFINYKVTGCCLNYKKIDNKDWNIESVCKYIQKEHNEYGWSHDAVLLEHSLKHYCIVEDDST